MRFALACNRNNQYQASEHLPDDEFEEFDSPETVAAIAEAIESFGHNVTLLEADKTFPEALARGRFEFVFNIAEGLGGRCRESYVPAVCEMVGIPYTGSDAITIGITLDKNLAKKTVADVVPVAIGRVFHRPGDIDLSGLNFPLFVKPNAEGSSKGIRNASKLTDPKKTLGIIKKVMKEYRGPVLVEEFLPGHEFTVGILGNERPQIIGIMEIAPKNVPVEEFVYSLETKRDYLNQVEYRIPPQLPKRILAKIEKVALNVFKALDCRDFSRVDVRLDADQEPHFLEVNPLPGLAPVKSDIVILSKACGLPYRDLIGKILHFALARHGFKA